MRVIDFFRFPVEKASEKSLFHIEHVDLKKTLSVPSLTLIDHSGIALFDSDIIYRENQLSSLKNLTKEGQHSFFFMPSIDGDQGEDQIKRAAKIGCKAIVFHPYIQKITAEKLFRVSELAKVADKLNLFICVCSAYGSRDIFNYYPLKTVVAIASVVNCPVVIVHGGGAKIMDAYLIADAFPHVMLDTSFSLYYWLDSPIEDWFVFAMRQLGIERWMFGSDSPFIELEKSVDTHIKFCQKHHFSPQETELLMGGTAARILGV